MTRDLLVQICLEQPEAVEDFPFGEHVSVFKVGGKMFALLPFGADAVSGGRSFVNPSRDPLPDGHPLEHSGCCP